MSMAWVYGAFAAISAASAIDSADKQRKAGNQAKDAARANATQSDMANNKANARKPDSAAAMAAAILAGKNGQSGTMLTGPSGVDPNTLMLGKATLLGGG